MLFVTFLSQFQGFLGDFSQVHTAFPREQRLPAHITDAYAFWIPGSGVIVAVPLLTFVIRLAKS